MLGFDRLPQSSEESANYWRITAEWLARACARGRLSMKKIRKYPNCKFCGKILPDKAHGKRELNGDLDH